MVRLRELTAGDIPRLALTDGGNGWHSGAERWNNYLAQHQDDRRVVMMVLQGRRIVGYGSLVWRSQHGPFAEAGIPEIQDMVVAADCRGQGIATRLIRRFEARARKAGKAVMGIGVGLYADYGSAQRLYIRLGYRPDGAGVTYDNQPIIPGSMVRLDDDLVLWLKKSIA